MTNELELKEPKIQATELQKFNVTKEDIVTLKTKYTSLTIAGIDDKAGYRAVDEARKDVKKKRVEIDKTRKALNEEAQNYIKRNNADAKEYIDILEVVENDCEAKIKAIDDEKERIAAEQKAAEAKRIADRVKLLLDNGCSFDSINYAIGENLSISHPTLCACSEEIFTGFLEKVKVQNEKEIAERAEAERKAKEESNRLEAERLAEIERQKAIAEQNRIESERLERLRKEQEDRELKIKQEAEKIAAEKNNWLKKRSDERCKELYALGLKFEFQHESFTCEGVNVYTTEISLSDDAEWAAIIGKITPAIAEAKKAAIEREEKAAAEAKRLAAEKESKRLQEIEEAKQEAIKQEQERQRLAEIERTEAVKKQQEEEQRQAALMPDKNKLLALSDAIGAIAMPDLTSDAAKAILVNVKDLITKTQLYISKQVKSL
jgi:hypothetical protein